MKKLWSEWVVDGLTALLSFYGKQKTIYQVMMIATVMITMILVYRSLAWRFNTSVIP